MYNAEAGPNQGKPCKYAIYVKINQKASTQKAHRVDIVILIT